MKILLKKNSRHIYSDLIGLTQSQEFALLVSKPMILAHMIGRSYFETHYNWEIAAFWKDDWQEPASDCVYWDEKGSGNP